MGNSETRKNQVWSTRVPAFTVLVIILPVFALGVYSIYEFVFVNHHPSNPPLQSQTRIRHLVLGIFLYASEHQETFPLQENWPQALLESGDIDFELLESPQEDGDGVSYIYVHGPFTYDANQILIYEDPKHWPKKGVLVGFADHRVEFVPFDEFDRMLAAQLKHTREQP